MQRVAVLASIALTPVAAQSFNAASCDVHSQCVHQGFKGNCCPTQSGEQLLCCNGGGVVDTGGYKHNGDCKLDQGGCAVDITATIAAFTSAAKFINYAVEDCPQPYEKFQRKCADDITSAVTDFAVASKTISSAVCSCGGPGTLCSQDISNTVASFSATSETLIAAVMDCDSKALTYDVFACVVDIFDVIDTLTHASKSIYDSVDTCDAGGAPKSGKCGSKVTAGQKQVHVPDCKGVGCDANGDDQDCAWCVTDLAACKAVYGSTCDQTRAARLAQGVNCEGSQPSA